MNMKTKMLFLGGSNLLFIKKLLKNDCDIDQIMRSTTASLFSRPIRRKKLTHCTDKIQEKFIQNYIFSDESSIKLMKFDYDVIVIEFLRDIVSSTVVVNGGSYTNPNEIAIDAKVDLTEVFGQDFEVVDRNLPSSDKPVLESVRHFSEGYLKEAVRRGKQVVVIRFFASRYDFSPKNGATLNAQSAQIDVYNRRLQSIYDFLIQDKDIIFIDIPSELQFSCATSPFGSAYTHLPRVAYDLIITKLIELFVPATTEDSSHSSIKERIKLDNIEDRLNSMSADISHIIQEIHRHNVNLDERRGQIAVLADILRKMM